MKHIYARDWSDADRLNTTGPMMTACCLHADSTRDLTPPEAIAEGMRSVSCLTCRQALTEALPHIHEANG